MDTPVPAKPDRIRPWLPYCAVFQEDIRQTLQNWVYRSWVLVCLIASVGYLLYRRGAYQEAGLVQPASLLVSELLRWCVFGSVTLIIVLTAGCISGERGTLADSVLSRGISRYQYFLGKWHARLLTVLATFLTLGALLLIGSMFLLHEDVSWIGSLFALLTVAALLCAVISWSVACSALFNNTLVGIAVLLVTIYGAGFALLLLPAHLPSPYRVLNSLPYILRGEYNWGVLGRLMGYSLLSSALLGITGLAFFSRRDV